MNMSNQQENKGIENLVSNNMMLSSWLNNVKNNNVNLYDTLAGNNVAEHLMNQNSAGGFSNRNEQRNPENPYQVN